MLIVNGGIVFHSCTSNPVFFSKGNCYYQFLLYPANWIPCLSKSMCQYFLLFKKADFGILNWLLYTDLFYLTICNIFSGCSVIKDLHVVHETQVDPRTGKIPWRRKWQPTPVFLPFWESSRTEDPGRLQFMVHKELETILWLNNNNIISWRLDHFNLYWIVLSFFK